MSIFNAIKSKITSTASKISNFFSKKTLTQADIDEIENILIRSDIGYYHTQQILKHIRSSNEYSEEKCTDVQEILCNYLQNSLSGIEKNIVLQENSPTILMFCGVNGSGKTTTIGKIANYYKKQNLSVIVGACDTFRAAASDQLKVWARNSDSFFCDGVNDINADSDKTINLNGSYIDPASVAYKTIDYAMQNSIDIVLLDTAGRLHTQKNLMEELKKINRVAQKLNTKAPHETILVVDSTVGQNAISQVEQFSQYVSITGLILTKLDGTTKGGAIVPISTKFNLPVYFTCIGERIDDISKFRSQDFVAALLHQ